MSKNTPTASVARKTNNLGAFFRSEVSLFLGLGTAAFFLALGHGGVEQGGHPAILGLVFIWLFLAVLWSAISVVRHADFLAVKCGEPYGTLILTLAAISIEVMMVSAAMLHGTNNPTLARDTMFAVLMIALNGLVGLSLLLGGLRHKEQYYNLQGTGSYLNAIMTLAVLVWSCPASLPRFRALSYLALKRRFLSSQRSAFTGLSIRPDATAHGVLQRHREWAGRVGGRPFSGSRSLGHLSQRPLISLSDHRRDSGGEIRHSSR